jgi:drug/metabolite transporter (DMT)-like permease
MCGMILCIGGVVFLLSQGSLQNLVSLNFTKGDGWILLAAFCFALYNTLVRKKPSAISPVNYLFVIFTFGTLLLLPFYCWELANTAPVKWNVELFLIIVYLGAGASVICFLCWNIAVGKLGAGRTALFGNLIPVFSSAEAAILLDEQFTWIHVVSMLLVFAGIIMANGKVLRR